MGCGEDLGSSVLQPASAIANNTIIFFNITKSLNFFLMRCI